MTLTPTTTKLGPDQASLRDVMRRMAEATCTDAPILSCTIDVRPEAHGERPGERNELILVRDRLDAISDGIPPHGPGRESFDADRRRIEELLDSEAMDDIDGLAIFACHRIGLWEAIGAEVPLETRVVAGPTADLFGLAHMLDDLVSAVVAVVDTNTCRLFVTRRGGLQERSGPDEPNAEHQRHETGGWSQARFQRHIDMQDRRFAREAADAIERLVRHEKPRHVILAGDERIISVLDPELPKAVRPLVEHVARIDMRAGIDRVRDEVAPILSALEEAEGRETADRALAGWHAGDLGVVGTERTLQALEAGRVDELVVDETVNGDADLRNELIRQATVTGARVEIVRDHDGLRPHDGIGATLRYRV